MTVSRLFFVALALATLGLAPETSAREWKNKAGKAIEAEFVAISGEKVVLRLAGGQLTEVKIRDLSLEDQAFLQARNEGGEMPEPKRPIRVPKEAIHFEGRWFHVVLEELTWKRAAEKAEQMGGRLVVIKDAATQERIVALADGLLLWIGATDEVTEGLWKWVDGEKVDYTAWGATEPNGGREENYLRLGVRGKWIDVDERGGANRVVGFIVEWP